MFQEFFKKVDAFNELIGCEGIYTLIDKDGEIAYHFSNADSIYHPTYKDKETYEVLLCKPYNKLLKGKSICIKTVISAGYEEEVNNESIKYLLEFMESGEGMPFQMNI